MISTHKQTKISLEYALVVVGLGMIIYGFAYAVPSISNFLYYQNTLELNNLHLLGGLNILASSLIISVFSFLAAKNIDKYFSFIYFLIFLHIFVFIVELLLFLFWKVSGMIILLQMSYDLIIPITLWALVYFYKKLQ